MQHAHQDHPQNLEMSLREHLLAAGATGQHPSPYPPLPPPAGTQGPDHPYQASESASPHGHLDPNVAQQHQAPYAQMGADDGGDDDMSPQSAKGKRELSTSKRAAQNRAAQRAFRQRKEGYIKKLEEQVKDFQNMEQNFRALQNENYQLREYILNLQSRLLETQSDIPPAPSHVNLPSSSTAGATGGSSSAAESARAAEQHMRRELPQQQGPPEPRPLDPQREAIAQLQAAAAQAEAVRPQHESPYGLGAALDYAQKRTRLEGEAAAGEDAKSNM